jgi:hypothetical protein
MHERECERGRSDRDQLGPRRPGEQQGEGDHRRHDQLARSGPRQLERVVGAGVGGREPGDRNLSGDHGQPTPDGVEDGFSGLVGEQEGERDEDRCAVEQHVRRVGAREAAQ